MRDMSTVGTSKKTRITVITICFNDLVGLQRTVSSVDTQSFGEWEHIIVDGGSRDGTQEWLQSLNIARGKRAWISESDRGIYDAMNKGLAQATGDFLIILNSGDTLAHAHVLDTYIESFKADNWGWAYGSVRYTDTRGRAIGAYTFDPFKRSHFVMGLSWIPFASVCFTRELVDRLGEFRTDIGSSADQEYLMRAVNVSEPHVISWFLADYARGGISQTVGARERELAWHQMRVATNNLWLSSRLADRAVSEILSLRKPVRMLFSRFGGTR